MASEILAAPMRTTNSQYRLAESARQKLIVSVRQIPADALAEIERQRLAFAARNNGCSFGLEPPRLHPSPSHK